VLGVPTIYRFLADHEDFASTDLSGCDVLLSGGAPLPESLIQLYQERGLEFRQGYGLTEACPGVTGMGPGECLRKAGSAGRPILYTDVKVVDPDGNDLPVGEAGEVIVRGPNVMKGYWNRPDATAEALRNGWLHTGDVGKFDEDGFLYIVDRKKDMIISGGENIYPAEIEKLLAGHELVQMATVVARPDDKWGEIPVAVVVARTDELTEDMLRDFLKTLARYKQPKEYVFVESLPLNASGKVIKAEVRKQIGITN
jgi:fatty-acyl-CoA synthase